MTDANSQAVDVDGYLNMIDLIASKLNLFVTKYKALKDQAVVEYKDYLVAFEMSKEENDEAARTKKKPSKKKKK